VRDQSNSLKNNRISSVKIDNHSSKFLANRAVKSNEESKQEKQEKKDNSALKLSLFSIGFLAAVIKYEHYQYTRFQRFKKDGFLKTGFMGISNDKARPVMEDFPIEEFYPKRMVVHIEAKELVSDGKDDYKWKISDEHSHVMVPTLEADISTEGASIKFDDTYTVDIDELLKYTFSPIVIGKGEKDLNYNEIEIVKNMYKDHHLVHINKKGEFYFIKNVGTHEVPQDYRDKTDYKSYDRRYDLKVKVKVWDDGTYTVFCDNLDGKLQGIESFLSDKVFHVIKNPNISFDDIKLNYDMNWIAYRFLLFTVLGGACVFGCLIGLVLGDSLIHRFNFKNYGMYKLAKRIGWIPVVVGLGITGVKLFYDNAFYSEGFVKLKELGFVEDEMEASLWKTFMKEE
jgi:hypothetical protein